MRSDIYKAIDKLQLHIRVLVRKYEEASYARGKYQEELIKTKTDLQNAKNKIAEQEKKIEHYELKQAFTTNKDNKKARGRISKMVKEIDKCISLLND